MTDNKISLDKIRNIGIVAHIGTGPSVALTGKGTTSSTSSSGLWRTIA